MGQLQGVWQIAKADFLERSRSYGFIITLIVTLYGASLFVPEKGAAYLALGVRGYRGIYRSGWVGLCVAVSTSLLLGLGGFYLVKNTIERDEKTRVGQLIAASPTSKLAYILGKTMSSFLILATIVLAASLSSLAMFYLRAEASTLELVKLLLPFVWITLPTMLLVSSIALLFESIKWLKGGIGNVLYFFVWLMMLIVPVKLMENSDSSPLLGFVDAFGFYKIIDLINLEVLSLFPDSPNSAGLISSAGPLGAKTFLWSGIDWTPELILGRLFWVAMGIIVVLISTVLFNRFDDHKKTTLIKNKPVLSKPRKAGKKEIPVTNTEWVESLSSVNFSNQQNSKNRFTYVYVLQAELKILLKGISWWWYVGLITLNSLAIILPIENAIKYILPLCWIFPMFIWSGLGVREYKHKTFELIYSCAETTKWQFLAMMLSAVIVTTLSSIGPFVKLIMTGNATGCIAWGIAVFFIPFFAACCGVWSKTSRVFEGIYILLWYIGPINGLPYFDFMGTVTGSAEMGMPLFYGGATLAALAMTFVQRRFFSTSS